MPAAQLKIVNPVAPAAKPGGLRQRRPLGDVLVESGALQPSDLATALALQARQNVRLGDILLAHGMVDEETLAAAIARQYNALPIDLNHMPPDARLIDMLGAEFCLTSGILPVRHFGGATLIASCRPDSFEAIAHGLPKALGQPILAFCSEKNLHAALLAVRDRRLSARAETRVDAPLSCRNWYSPAPRNILAGLIFALAAATLAAPQATFLVLFGWALLCLAAATALKSAAAWRAWKLANAPSGPPAERPPPIRLPVVSVMVPLFREEAIAGRLIERLSRLTYPRELLDICLVVEDDDAITHAAIARTQLPYWMRVITVPGSGLRTKPRALNYALDFCRGTIVGVYDAEDAPEPDQIHHVVRCFHESGPQVACVQGALDFYNSTRNWMARCFTVEYATWFRLMLPGISSLGLAVPLGGTTLFFRRDILKKLGGWDAHNVTEDADLGIRLARMGYCTRVVNSTTFEEANCRLWPWIRQRSRWLKGYAMTWSTHMKTPLGLYRDLGPRAFWGFQVMFLGTLSQFVLLPVLLSCWLLAFGLPHPLGGLWPGWAFYVLGAALLGTEIVTILIGMMGVTLAGKHRLRKWVPSLHFYFPLAALATYKAIFELIAKPFYWDKTLHGIADEEEPAS